MDALEDRVAAVLAEVMAAVGSDVLDPPAESDLEDSGALIELAIELVVERLDAGAGDAALGRLLAALGGVLREVQAHAAGRRLDALAEVHDGLSRLRGLGSLARLVECAAEQACASCGVDRALLFGVEGGMLAIESVHVDGDGREAEALRRTLRGRPVPLDVVHRRTALLIAEPPADDPLGRTRPFVAAPVVSEGHVVGVLEADRAGRLTRLHRDALAAFAHGLGYAVERAVLLERLHAQRDHVRQLTRTAQQVVDDLCDSQVRLARVDEGSAMVGSLARPGVDGLLSAREVDVIDAMTSGATNAEIAARLYITEDTVKTHVKQIFRKLGAANRVQAVYRYVQLSGPAAEAPRAAGSRR